MWQNAASMQVSSELQHVSETKREKSFGADYAIPQCPAKDNDLSPVGEGETL